MDRSNQISDLEHRVLAALRRCSISAECLLWLLSEDEDDQAELDSQETEQYVLISHHEDDDVRASTIRNRLTDLYRTWVNGDASGNQAMMPGVSDDDAAPHPLIDDVDLRRSIFMSHSRRDPGAINAAYAIVRALRYGRKRDGQPICKQTYLPGSPTMFIWIDKEQLKESGGEDVSDDTFSICAYCFLS
eukprot:SAG22_NODE_596_length_8727_cov_107.360338_10_plen_189_part_00